MPNSTDTKKGWYPGARKLAIPEPNFSVGNFGRKAAVLHIIVGSAKSAEGEFSDPAKRKSSHFIIDKKGGVVQCVSALDTAYANGLSWDARKRCWIDPEGVFLQGTHQPPWKGLTPPTNPNWYTISIEREGVPADIPTEAMNASTISVLRWLAEQFPTWFKVFIPGETLIGHRDISPVNRPQCPGPHVDFAALASAANGVREYQVLGVPVYQSQSGRGTIAGYLQPGEKVVIDKTYPEGQGHLSSGLGFVWLDSFEALP